MSDIGLHLDITEGTRGRKDWIGWIELVRTAKVVGAIVSTGHNGHTRLEDALETSGMPALWSQHPDFTYLYLEEQSPKAITSMLVEIDLIYRRKGLDKRIDLKTNLTQKTINKDHAGALMTVTYKGKAQTGTAKKLFPDGTIVVSQTEFTSPAANMRAFNGKLNSGAWSLDEGCSAKQYLCFIDGTTRDYGKTWQVTYTFQYKEETWDETDSYIDPQTKLTPPDVDTGATNGGIATFQIYDTANYDDLGL